MLAVYSGVEFWKPALFRCIRVGTGEWHYMKCCFLVADSNEKPPYFLFLLNDPVNCRTGVFWSETPVFAAAVDVHCGCCLCYLVYSVTVCPTHTHLHCTLPVVTFLKQSLLITGKGLHNILSERSMRRSRSTCLFFIHFCVLFKIFC